MGEIILDLLWPAIGILVGFMLLAVSIEIFKAERLASRIERETGFVRGSDEFRQAFRMAIRDRRAPYE